MKISTLTSILVGLICTYCNNLNAQVNLNQGLAAYYPFNGNVKDSTVNGNDGTIMGAPSLTSNRWNQPNTCYRFNGNGDYIRVPDDSTLKPAVALTISAWVLCEDTSSWNVVACKRAAHNENPYNSYILYASGSANKPQNWSFIVSTSKNTSFDVTQTSQIKTSQWVHLVGTYDSSTANGPNLKLFVDGQLVSSRIATGSVYYSDSSLRIGMAIPGPSTQYFKGKIDDVRIYSRAINAQEVTALFSQQNSIGSTLNSSNKISIFPNPANDLLFISGEYNYQTSKVTLFDITGKLVLENTIESNGTIDVSKLSSGFYITKLIDVKTGSVLTSQKISIQ